MRGQKGRDTLEIGLTTKPARLGVSHCESRPLLHYDIRKTLVQNPRTTPL